MRRAVVVLCLVATACGAVSRDPSLTEAMGDIPAEVDEAVTDLRTVLGTPSATDLAAFTQRLVDLRLAPTLAVLYDKAGRVEGDAFADDTARYADFVGRALLASEDLDTAASGQDLLAISIAWLRIEAEAGAMAVAVAPDACPVLAPALVADLCRPARDEGYEQDLDRILRRFLAAYRPAIRLPEAFGDTVRSQAIAAVASEVVALVDRTVTDLDALDTPNAYVGVERAFTAWLAAVGARWEQVNPQQTDPLLGRFLADDLAAIACDAEDPYRDGRGLLLAAVPDSTVPALAALLLGDFFDCP